MLVLPKEKLFSTDQEKKASASILLTIAGGVSLTPGQVQSISQLVGSSVPGLDPAAITITVMTLATVNTLGIQVDFLSALLLSIVAAIAAAGASGVAGGSLLLIPMATSLFGIDNATAMQVVSIGFIIGVVQDSA